MMKKIRKPVSILLVFMMIVSLFAIVPLSASATSSYYDLARGTLIQPNDIFSFEDIGSFKFADYDDPTIIHEVKGSDFSYNKATLSVTDGYYSFGSTKLLPTSVSPGGLLIADYDSTTKMATFGVQNITHSFDETTGTLTIGGSGVVPEHYAMTGTGASGVVFTQSNLVKHLIIDATDMIAIQNSAFMAYNGGCVLEDVKINSTSSTPLIIEEQAVFYRSGNTVTVTVNAMKLATVTNSPVKNYNTPVNLIYNVEQPITFKKNALTDPSRYLTVTFPTHCNILIPGGAQFTDSQLQEEYDHLAEDGYEEYFWDMNPDLVEGTDYVLGDARYEELTPLNASLVVGNKNTALFSAYTITDESVNGTVTASVNGTDVTEAAADADVTLSVAPAEGYQFVSISAGDVSLTTVTEGSQYSFTMPAKNITVKAEFEAIPTYTVTWKNGETVLETDENVAQGTMPEYNGTTPVKDEDGDYIYTFKGWSPEVSAVTGDVTYTAVFDSFKKYVVYIKTPKGSSYNLTVTNNTTIAQIKADLADELGIPAAQQRLIYAGEDLEDTKTLVDYNIQKEDTIHDVPKSYTVTWLNDDGATIDTTTVYYGDMPEYNGNTPVKDEDAINTYTFSGWTDGTNTYGKDDTLPAVTGDITYTATFTAENKEVKNVIAMINALPEENEVTLDDAEQIEDARAAYYALSYYEQTTLVPEELQARLSNAKTALDNLKHDAVNQYINGQADSFYIAMAQKIGSDEGELMNALQEAISAIQNVSYDSDISLDENKAAVDAVVQAQTEVMNNKMTEVCNAYKAQKIAQVQGLAQEGDPDAVNMEIEITADRINGEMFEDTNISSFKSRVDYHVEQAQEQISYARVEAFNNYKTDKAYDVRSLTQAGDSEAVMQIIDNAVQAIDAVSYDTSKTYVENKAAVDAAADITLLEQQVIAQRNADKAAAVTAQINALPADVTVNDKEQINAARAAYDALTDDQKVLVTNETLDKLTDAEEAIADLEAAKAVEDMINALPTEVTVDDEEQIDAARQAYDALTDDQKALIDTDILTKLTDAETALAEEQKAAADQDAADAVTGLIENLPTDVTLEHKDIVEAARQDYEALTDDQKVLVTPETLEKLEAAEKAIADLEAAKAVTDQINALGEVTLDDKATVEEARQAYDALTDDQKALVDDETVNKLTAAETVIADREAAKAVEDMINALPDQITPENKQTFLNVGSAFIGLSHAQEEYLSEEAKNKIDNVLHANYFVTGADQLPEEITPDDKQSVTDLRSYYDDASDDVKALISDEYMNKLVSAEQKIADLEAVKAVEDMIKALPAVEDITLNDKDAVNATYDAFGALTDDQVFLLDGDLFDDLLDALDKIQDLEAAKVVEDKIKALPDVILLEDKDDVEAARAAYDALEPEQKDLIDLSVVEKLEDAEEVIADREAAKAVEDMINALPTEITLADKAAVDAANAARLNLTPAQADYLTFSAIDKLFKAQDKIRDLEAAKAVEDMINALPADITVDDEDQIEAARQAYEALTDDQKALVTPETLEKLTDAETTLDNIVLLGDVDGDGDVTSVDATMIQRYLVSMRNLSDKQIKAADIDGDGEATILDVTLIQRYLAGITVKYPINEYV